jgi:hypothetical protein
MSGFVYAIEGENGLVKIGFTAIWRAASSNAHR